MGEDGIGETDRKEQNTSHTESDASDELRSAACHASQGEGERSDWRVLQQIKNALRPSSGTGTNAMPAKRKQNMHEL